MKIKYVSLMVGFVFLATLTTACGADPSVGEALKVAKLTSSEKTNSPRTTFAVVRRVASSKLDENKPSTLDVVPCKVKAPEPVSLVSSRWSDPQHFKDYPDLFGRIQKIIDHKPSGWDRTDFYTIISTDGQSACDVFRWCPWKVGLGRYCLFPGAEINANYGIDNSGHGWEDYRALAIISTGRN